MLGNGALYQKEDVKVLIIYTLSQLNRAIPTRIMGDMFLNMSTKTAPSIFFIKKRKALHCLSSWKQFSHYRFRTYTEGHYWHDV